MSTMIVCRADNGLAAAAELAARLREGLGEASEVVIDTAPVAAADISFVQVIESARLTAAAQGTALRLAAPVGPALRRVIEDAGLLWAQDPADLAFWFHERDPA
jgi:hypothetical protein